jgi:hypothetical protein
MRAISISDASGETAPVKPWELLGQTCTPEANDMRLAPRTSTSPSRAALLDCSHLRRSLTQGVPPPKAAAKLLALLNRYSAKERKNSHTR